MSLQICELGLEYIFSSLIWSCICWLHFNEQLVVAEQPKSRKICISRSAKVLFYPIRLLCITLSQITESIMTSLLAIWNGCIFVEPVEKPQKCSKLLSRKTHFRHAIWGPIKVCLSNSVQLFNYELYCIPELSPQI